MGNGAKSVGTTVGVGTGGFMLGLMIGAAVAGVAVLLYAPRSGKETRDSLKEEVTATQEMFQNWMKDAKEMVDNYGQIIRSSVKSEMQTMGNGQRETV